MSLLVGKTVDGATAMFLYIQLPLVSPILLYLRGPRGFGDLERMAIYFQGAGEHL